MAQREQTAYDLLSETADLTHGVRILDQFLHDNPREQMAYVATKLKQYNLLRVIDGTSNLLDDGDRPHQRWLQGFWLGGTALMGTVHMQFCARTPQVGAQITRYLRIPRELPMLDHDQRSVRVLELGAEGAEVHGTETEPLYEQLSSEWGAAYLPGIAVGIGYIAQRFDEAWEIRRQEQIAAIAASEIRAARWSTLADG